MPRDRFLLLLKCWHFADNALDRKTDKLFKLRPLLEPILESFKTRLTPSKSLVIDESMIPWRGRLSFRQYIKNKTHKYGVKLYKLCTISGYVINFMIYTGKGTTTPGKSHAESVVDFLMNNRYGLGHNLYCNNFYTSCKLAEKLITEKTRLCGTVRKNSKRLPSEVVNAKLRKGQISGKQKRSVKCIKWVDKRPVLMISSFEDHDATLQETGKIVNFQAVKKPKCVIDYNSAKKGVDYSDQMASYQSPERKGLKWYRKVATELFFGTAITNSWILYNQTFPTNRIPILEFRQRVIQSLVVSADQPQRPRTPKRIHTLTELGPAAKKRRKCVGCYKILRATMSSHEADNIVKEVYTFCEECEGKPAYCLKCFNDCHAKQITPR